MRTIVCKMHPENNFAPDILGETGCANCGHTKNEHEDELCNRSFPSPDIPMEWDDNLYICGCEDFKPKKAQTIRDKPMEVGQKIAIWEMWRGMKKGWYCKKCLGLIQEVEVEGDYQYPEGDYCENCSLDNISTFYPRKLLDAEITECVPIEFKWYEDDQVLDLRINGKYEESIEYDMVLSKQCPFVKADTPSWDNRRFIDFFLKQYPKIKSDWIPMYIWKWKVKP